MICARLPEMKFAMQEQLSHASIEKKKKTFFTLSLDVVGALIEPSYLLSVVGPDVK